MMQVIFAIATFSGTIIGVGIFGLPYVTMKFGFWPTVLFYFPLLTAVTMIIHLTYGEICLRTDGTHRLPGYAGIYLGKWGQRISLVSAIVGFYGSMLAYLIIGSQFTAQLLIPLIGGTELVYILIFFAFSSLVIFLDAKFIARAEFGSLVLLLLALVYLLVKGLPLIEPANFSTGSWQNIFLPYGVIMFSLGGMSVVPELREFLGKQAAKLKGVIIAGIAIPVVIYLAFIVLILGLAGAETSRDALSGLSEILGEKALIAGFIFGIMATFTSYISVGQTLKKMLWYDFKFEHFIAWVAASFIPLLLYFIGLKDFLAIIGFTGAVTIGLDGILTFFIYFKAKQTKSVPAYQVNLPKFISILIIALFIVGVALEIYYLA